MAEFRKSPFVDTDLMGIWGYIAQDNPTAADKVVRAAYATFQSLARNPGMGRVHEAAEGLQAFPIKGFQNYLIFYRETSWGVEIARVLHGARDLRVFFEETNPPSDG